jgi:HK97 family phage portal protein
MPNLLDRPLNWLAEELNKRGFRPGAAVVSGSDTYFGIDTSTFRPEEYGNYIANSNAVYTCATTRADLLSSLPPRLYKIKRGKRKEEVEKGLLYTLLQKVNPFWTFSRLVNMTELGLGLWGTGFWFLERGKSTKETPREIWWARPDRVMVHPHPEHYISHFTYQPLNGSQPLVFMPWETIWFRYPNPLNEFEGLSPLAAARLAADYASAAMQSNVKLFQQGMQMGGLVVPKSNLSGAGLTTQFSPEQAKELENLIDRRFSSVDKAHRWGVLRFDAELKPLGFSPKDAEFLAGQRWALEEVARAYKIPQDLIGGQRTYENVDAAYKGAWTNAILPEARGLCGELKEQLLPLFPGEADLIELDASEVAVLQEEENEQWLREREQLDRGVITINYWREEHGLDPVEWGDVWWAPSSLTPIESAELPEMPEEQTDGEEDEAPEDQEAEGETKKAKPDKDEEPRSSALLGNGSTRAISFGSADHARAWRRFARRTSRFERQLGSVIAGLFERQKDSVIDRLKAQDGRNLHANLLPGGTTRDDTGSPNLEPFDMKKWLKLFREAVRPVLKEIVEEEGEDALDEIGIGVHFDVSDDAILDFIETRTQRFAKRVNETTWDALVESLQEGIDAGESIAELAERVDAVMGSRIRSSKTTIARTEVIGASNGAITEAWRQSEVVIGKSWLAALDDATRSDHEEAHIEYQENPIPIDEDFVVGGASGPHPGGLGDPSQDINCRCTMTSVIDQRAWLRKRAEWEKTNGPVH